MSPSAVFCRVGPSVRRGYACFRGELCCVALRGFGLGDNRNRDLDVHGIESPTEAWRPEGMNGWVQSDAGKRTITRTRLRVSASGRECWGALHFTSFRPAATGAHPLSMAFPQLADPDPWRLGCEGDRQGLIPFLCAAWRRHPSAQSPRRPPESQQSHSIGLAHTSICTPFFC